MLVKRFFWPQRAYLRQKFLKQGAAFHRRNYARMSFETGHTYHDAIMKLNELQTPHRLIAARQAAGLTQYETAVDEMRDCVRRIGYKPRDFDQMNIVHVAGTKGKGTTCAYVNSILNAHKAEFGFPKKIGLFTSPHILQVRERIQINNEPISEYMFAQYFFQVWNRLEESAEREGLDPLEKPKYFKFLTLLSFHIYRQEGVDAAIYEVGVGGRFDATNIFENPVVTGITALGIDHVTQLGSTIESISWHKAGIFKTGSPAYSVPQPTTAYQVLKNVAEEVSVQLKKVDVYPGLHAMKIMPNAEFQKQNASLAIALSFAVLDRLGQSIARDSDTFPTYVVRGVEDIKWRGRCEVKIDGKNTWYLDGAHTAESLEIAAIWFSTQVLSKTPIRVLVFNQQSRKEATELLTKFQANLHEAGCPPFTHVIFCTNVTWKTKGYSTDLADMNNDSMAVSTMLMQKEFADIWKKHCRCGESEIMCVATAEEVVDSINTLSDTHGSAQILVTGSFRHMGGILTVLEGES